MAGPRAPASQPPRLRGEIRRAATPAELTPRQRQVLRLVAAGQADKEIAAALGIAEHTVKNHLAALRARAGCRSRVELALWEWRWRAAATGAPVDLDWASVDLTAALARALADEAERRIRRLPQHYCRGRAFVHTAGVVEAVRCLLTGRTRRPAAH
jgi:DNA-binding CsgD family transcriptional regulator